jgi:two-component system, cell cycle response regulator
MSASRVTLLGFTRFERATFESFFRLTSKRSPAYVPEDDPAAADFIVADADDEAVVRDIRKLKAMPRTLMLGAMAGTRIGAAAQLPRPINLMLVMRALDTLPRVAVPPAAEQPAAAQPDVDDVPALPTLPDLPDVPDLPPRPVQAPVAAAPADQAEPAEPTASSPPATKLDHILVVDDSDVALRFMALHLQRFGFQIHLVRSGHEAIDRVARQHFEFVFLDVMMEGLDGFQTCKAIKRSTYAGDRPPPTVVMVTSRGTAVDKLRGTMAGCDAYLTKPIEENALLKIIGDREVQSVGYSDTAVASTMF